MIKVLDVAMSLFINIVLSLTWVIYMISTSNIPVDIQIYEVKGIIITLLVFTLLYSLYLIKSKCNLLNLIQSGGLLFLWGICLYSELKYSYHPVSRIVDIVGFGLNLLVFIQIIVKIIKKTKLKA